MEKQIVRRPLIQAELPDHLHPVLKRVYAGRAITSSTALELDLKKLLPYHDLKGIDAAVELLVTAVTQQQSVLIVGDFDADGATSSALAIRALTSLGAQQVDFLVPNRFEFGYGLTPEIVEVALGADKSQQPDLIITVDNGISSVEGVAAAREEDIKVLVTDHHLPGAELPAAQAIVNPNQEGCDFSAKNSAGVAVIFYVMLALRNALREAQWFTKEDIAEPNLAELLDLVALGTVADVVPLDYNNRILVAQGLRRIKAGRCSAGISALLQVSGRRADMLAASDLGFALGPRLNAAGRLDDMSIGIQCLLSDDPEEALSLACVLDDLNQDRKAIEADMKEQALAQLDKVGVIDSADVGVCLYDAEWHQGVIGILASRIKDRLHRPVIAFADGNDGYIKGSARSIRGFHIRDALDQVAKENPGVLSKFGGHAMAAGMTIRKEDFDVFARAFNQVASAGLDEQALQVQLLTDGELTPRDFSLELAHLLRDAGPWGQQFPEPLFDGEFDVLQQRLVGEKHLKLKLSISEAKPLDAIAFFVDLDEWPNDARRVRLVYRLDVNEFNGYQNVQLIVEHIEALHSEALN